MVPEVCASVDSFLGIQNGNVPRVGMYFGFSDVNLILALLSSASSVHKLVTLLSPNYDGYLVTDISSVISGFLYLNHSSYYNSLTKHIVMERGVRAIFIPVLAHEYAHVVQQRKGIISPCGGYLSYPIFREGHARGVQRYVAEAYCQKEDNEAYLYDISQTTVAELKRAYIWMCKQLGTQVHNSLLRVKSEKDCLEERMWISLGGKPSSHAIGNAFFLVLEAQKDRTIYQTVLI